MIQPGPVLKVTHLPSWYDFNDWPRPCAVGAQVCVVLAVALVPCHLRRVWELRDFVAMGLQCRHSWKARMNMRIPSECGQCYGRAGADCLNYADTAPQWGHRF